MSLEKTFWGTTQLTFLGLLIDTVAGIEAIPKEKVERAIAVVNRILGKCKVTVKELQKLTGFLNFLCHCIVPGCAFTRRIYSYFSSAMMPYHHINVNREIKQDLQVWRSFLTNPVIYCRPFLDYTKVLSASDLNWYSDASGVIGYGGVHDGQWFAGLWDKDWLDDKKPSIEFLELYAVSLGILLWAHKHRNARVCLYCDNKTVVHVINAASSSCKYCMKLARLIILTCLSYNVRIFAKYVTTKDNDLSDALSRNQMKRFWDIVHTSGISMENMPCEVPIELVPVTQFWSDINQFN